MSTCLVMAVLNLTPTVLAPGVTVRVPGPDLVQDLMGIAGTTGGGRETETAAGGTGIEAAARGLRSVEHQGIGIGAGVGSGTEARHSILMGSVMRGWGRVRMRGRRMWVG